MAPRKNRRLYRSDASQLARSQLDYVLDAKELPQHDVAGERVSVEEAIRGEGVYEVQSDRDITRVLFISRDPTLLNPTQQSLDGFVNLSDLFDEVHVLILRHGIPAKYPVLRVAKNVWLYTASAQQWWRVPFVGLQLARQELEFGGGFRPDLIVARDPFESAYVAWRLAQQHDRPKQLHILEDFMTGPYARAELHNGKRQIIAQYLIPRFLSVRTANYALEERIKQRYDITDLETLPRFNNFERLLSAEETLDLKQKYPAYSFFILYVGSLGHDSTLYRALDAARFALENRRVAMIVLGDGPARPEFEQRAKTLKIADQVIFEYRVKDPGPYLTSANLLIVTDTTPESEFVTQKGAAAGIPLVLARSESRADLFEDGQSAFLCEPENTQAFTNAINELLNEVVLRRQFALATKEIIRTHFHEDPLEYKNAYRQSIEDAFFVTEDEDASEGADAKIEATETMDDSAPAAKQAPADGEGELKAA